MATVFPQGNYRTVGFSLPDTNENTIYTCNVHSALITHLWCADDAGAARTVTVKTVLDSTTYVLVSAAAIATNTPLEYEFKPLALANGDTVTLTGSAAGIEGFLSLIEVTGRV